MVRKSMVRGNVVAVLSVGLMLGLSGVAQAGDAEDEYDRSVGKTAWDPKDYPDCAEAIGKFYVSGAAGGLGGPAGIVGGLATGLPDIYLDCPTVEPWQQNGT
jgi:hypothetical protein